jgi:hypothetical protein
MLRSPSKSLRKLAQEKDIGLATAHKAVREKMNLYRRSWTSLPAPFISAQRLPELTVVTERFTGGSMWKDAVGRPV